MTAVSYVGVLGCGLMGSGIAETVARAGPDVLVVEVGPAALDAGRRRIEASLDRAVRRARLTGDERDRALARLSFSTDLGDLADRDLVVEAAVEDRDLKCALFRDVDKVLGDGDAILASNTSSIPLTDLATVTGRPDRVVGLHFFNPVPVQALVEIIPALTTGADTVERVRRFAVEQLGKTAVQPRTGRGSSSTPCCCRICSPPSAWSSRAPPPPRTSTTAWNSAAPIPWARSGSST